MTDPTNPQARVAQIHRSHTMGPQVHCMVCNESDGRVLEFPCITPHTRTVCAFMGWTARYLGTDDLLVVQKHLSEEQFNAYEAELFRLYVGKTHNPTVPERRFYSEALLGLTAADRVFVLGPLLEGQRARLT